MTTEIQATPEAEAPVVVAEPVPAPAPKRTRTARPNAKAKAAAKTPAKGKTAGKAPRQAIPNGMTRSRGALIPVANGQCAIAVGDAQCHNPGRWEATIQGRKIRTCTTHKRSNPAKLRLFAAPARRERKAKTA